MTEHPHSMPWPTPHSLCPSFSGTAAKLTAHNQLCHTPGKLTHCLCDCHSLAPTHSNTCALHMGHVARCRPCCSSHGSTQCLWNECPHGRLVTRCPCQKLPRQIEHTAQLSASPSARPARLSQLPHAASRLAWKAVGGAGGPGQLLLLMPAAPDGSAAAAADAPLAKGRGAPSPLLLLGGLRCFWQPSRAAVWAAAAQHVPLLPLLWSAISSVHRSWRPPGASCCRCT